MKRSEIMAILDDWNMWRGDADAGFPRLAYLERLTGFLSIGRVVVVTGARRSGKSFIMRQLLRELIKKGVARQETLFVNLEDPRFVDLDAKSLQEIYEIYVRVMKPAKKPCIFLDEVQAVRGWEKWAGAMQELKKADVVVSGSNATMLSRELGTLLTGRHIDLTVFPLSFQEYLRWKNIEVTDEMSRVRQKAEIERRLEGFIEAGSFPEIVLTGKKELLLTSFEDILVKDIAQRYRIRKTNTLRILAKFYLTNIASPVTFSSVEKFLKISADTAEKFSGYLEDAYMCFFLKRFSFTVKEQEKSPRKVYAVDTGLANSIGFRFSPNTGRLAENVVFIELKRRQAVEPLLELYYWKDQQQREVDFVLKRGNDIEQLIQVCWVFDNLETRKREISALLKGMEALKVSDGLIITREHEEEQKIRGKTIRFLPLWQWLVKP